MTNKFSIILASGEGTRYGSRKQFSLLDGKELYLHVVEKALNNTDVVVIVTNSDLVNEVTQKLTQELPSPLLGRVFVVAGGKERSDSVCNGLTFIKNNISEDRLKDSITIVMESARPKVTDYQVQQLLESIEEGAKSSTFYIPVDNATYLGNSSGEVGEYLNRGELYSIQTPQAFSTESLVEAFNIYNNLPDEEKFYLYEDCHVVLGTLGIAPKMILGSENLLKITRMNDMKSMINMNQSKTVLITGSTGSLGAALVEHFKKLKYNVLAPTRNELDLLKGFDEVKNYLKTIDVVPDILINNAGIMKIDNLDSELFESNYSNMMQVNLNNPLILTRELLLLNPNMTTINISSTSGESGRAGFMGYGISKSGMIIMTESLVEEGYSSYCINPGRLKSKLRAEIFGEEDSKTLLEPKHVVCVVDNIINGLYINGSILTVRVDDGIFKIKEFKRK